MARESILPLSIGLLLAVAVHLLAVPAVRQQLATQDSDYRLQARQTDQEDQPDQPPDQRLRRITPGLAERRSSEVNLVSYDHYQQLMARKGQVDQPAVQTDVQPDPSARQTPVEPTPPQTASPDQPVAEQPAPPQPARPAQPTPPTPPAAEPAPEQDQPREDEPGESPDPPAPALPDLPVADMPESDDPDLLDVQTQTDANDAGRLASDLPRPDPQSELDEPQLASPNVPQPQPRPEPQPPQRQPSPPSPARQAQPAEQPTDADDPQPTAAVRDDFESPPVRRIHSAQVRPGSVLSVQGVRIRTARPRISPIAAMTAVPRNPVFTVHFNQAGNVTHVIKRRSTGYDHVDGPIVASLYKWTAEGNLPEEGLTIRALQLILSNRPDEDEDEADEDAEPQAAEAEANDG